MRTKLVLMRRSLVVRHGKKEVLMPIDMCAWCTDDALCSMHGAMADRIRSSLAKTAAKRGA